MIHVVFHWADIPRDTYREDSKILSLGVLSAIVQHTVVQPSSLWVQCKDSI